MKNKTIIGFVLFSLATLVARGETAWIGGDQSATPGSTFHVNENWSTGVAPVSQTTEAIVIDQAGANVRWISSTSGFYLNGPVSIGGTSSPNVTIDFQSNRTTPPSNDNTSNVLFSNTLSINGSNTTTRRT